MHITLNFVHISHHHTKRWWPYSSYCNPFRLLATNALSSVCLMALITLEMWNNSILNCNKINVFFIWLMHFGYVNHVISICELTDTTYEDLFCKTCSPQHCLYHLMTEHCDYLCGMRARGHNFKPPDFSTILHKKSLLVSALYIYM